MTTIAFHGQFATPGMLRVDAGDPEWIDEYWELYQDPAAQLLAPAQYESVVLAGYSRGGYIACELANFIIRHTLKRPKTAGLILYEAPIPREGLLGDMPVVYVRSAKRSKLFWREWRKDRIIQRLKQNHDVTVLGSKHGHTKTVTLPDGSTRKGHGWDVGLNDELGEWVREISGK